MMTSRSYLSHLLVMIVFMLSVPLYAEEENMEETMAKSLLNKAIETIEQKGPIKAFYEFNTKREEFCPGDIYVWVMTQDGTILASCRRPTWIGLNVMQFEDAAARRDEKKIGSELVNYALQEREGVFEYEWWNPANGQIETKHDFFTVVSPDKFKVDFIVLVAVFTP